MPDCRAIMRRYIIDALHDLAELEQDTELWTAVYPLDWETVWTPEERSATTQQVLDDMRRLCLVTSASLRSLFAAMICFDVRMGTLAVEPHSARAAER